MTSEFLEVFADFYGDTTLDELSIMFGVRPAELAAYMEDLIDDNFDELAEEMEYIDEEFEDSEED